MSSKNLKNLGLFSSHIHLKFHLLKYLVFTLDTPGSTNRQCCASAASFQGVGSSQSRSKVTASEDWQKVLFLLAKKCVVVTWDPQHR